MYYSSPIFALAALISIAHSHGVLLSAVGDSGESQGFLVNPELARNCTTISPCQQDSTIIRDSEIKQNIVNACGRTEIAGNIDIGEQTENELAVKRVTKVSGGSVLAVTIHQVNADGAGPYECDMDETSNATTDFTPLTVSNNIPGANGLSQAKEQDFVINVQMPDKFNCIGASTGNICTVRCRNAAVAGPFGGCFAVQQTDGQGRKAGASGVNTAQTLKGIQAQILQNQKDLDAAIAANQAAGAAGGNEGASAISALATATATAATTSNAAATASASATAGAGKGNGRGKGNGNQNQNGQAAGQNGNTNAGQGGNGNRVGNGNAANNQQGNANANTGAQNGIGNTGNGIGGGRGNGIGNGNGRNQNKKRGARFMSKIW
ncbi:hypothetical protein P153DRAFT_348739 [Dothidotthia symphoricarpi CBS 119687]|uniref:GEgh 16 protein n=1 Tax=Dothidotthia symphoricarpi CBS 119687 TaxID=1392245 RepID=A0A6A6A3M6_9PLEO|nr:uncharacterized protein P153DRAFT_348739 [Dothidotthia symphoricarpi CBS 119687]KAF2125507.1 hypothetical protein P153DRAFT_348739 [Dothidotthia symphoricarpi CBS 119687]